MMFSIGLIRNYFGLGGAPPAPGSNDAQKQISFSRDQIKNEDGEISFENLKTLVADDVKHGSLVSRAHKIIKNANILNEESIKN